MTRSPSLRIAFGGDREIAVRALKFVIGQGVTPEALLVPAQGSHTSELIAECRHLERGRILEGSAFREPAGHELLSALDLDYILCVHFPLLVPASVLAIPAVGVLNLHPAFLPYNRGWHTPSWAILDQTPYGATLHFMAEEVDAGDIVHQKELPVLPHDTADSLYKRVAGVEMEVLKEAWPLLLDREPPRVPQDHERATAHAKSDLFDPSIQQIRLDEMVTAGGIIRRLRALSTDRPEEAAYVVDAGIRYRIQLRFLAELEQGISAERRIQP